MPAKTKPKYDIKMIKQVDLPQKKKSTTFVYTKNGKDPWITRDEIHKAMTELQKKAQASGKNIKMLIRGENIARATTIKAFDLNDFDPVNDEYYMDTVTDASKFNVYDKVIFTVIS